MKGRALVAAGVAVAAMALGAAPASGQTISKMFTSGGEPSGAPFENDFVELKNLTASPLSLTGTSIQYAPPAGTTWEVTALSESIPPDGYYLVALDSNGTGGEPLPPPDATGTSDLQDEGGKVALVNTTTPLSGACPTSSSILDLVGWGTADCYEGEPEEAVLGVFYALIRNDLGCTDTNSNIVDINQGAPFTPNNTGGATHSCANDPPDLQPIGDKQVDEGVELNFVVDAFDPDGDNVTKTASNLPPGATFNGAAFEWTPTCGQAGTYPAVHFEASDPENATESEDITITVNEACSSTTTTTLTVAKKGKKKLLASGGVAPPQPDGEVTVTLLRKRRGGFKQKAEQTVELAGGSGYEAKFKRPRRGRCRVVAEFAGNAEFEPSSATKTFRCRKP